MSAHKKTKQNKKIAQKLHSNEVEGTEREAKSDKVRHPKTANAYWTSRVSIPSGSTMYAVQIHYRGERHRFPLETADKAKAAEKCRNIYLSLVGRGWKETLLEFNPDCAPAEKSTKVSTVGELIAEVSRTVSFNPITFSTYTRCLRRIAADISGIGDQAAVDEAGNPKKDRRGRIKYLSRRHSLGNELWREAVDAVSLSALNADAVNAWRVELVKAAGESPLKKKRAEVSSSSILRNARSLFIDSALEFARANLVLPDPLPFSGKLKLTKPVSTFKSKVDVLKLIATAQKELSGEPLKIFLLGMLSGLRKNEVDKLEWQAIDFRRATVDLKPTEFFKAKSEDSEEEVDLDPELLVLMRQWHKDRKGDFVIESDKAAKTNDANPQYRCEKHFQALYAWLRKQGVTAQKPLHELRKELGAHLASEQGLFAAQAVLRHAQISTTSEYYTDKKRKITGGLGTHLSPLPYNVVEVEFKAPPVASKSEGRAAQ